MSKQEVFTYLEDGSILWNASLILLRYLADKRRGDFEGKRVLELGAGKGHLAMGLSRLGAHVTTTEAACQEPCTRDRGERGSGDGTTCKCWGCVEQLRRGVQSQLNELEGASEGDVVELGKWVPVSAEKEGAEPGSVRVMSLDWGPDGTLKGSNGDIFGDLDVVVMSECIYNQSDDSLYDDEFHDGLAWTLEKVVQRPGTLVYNVFVDRPFSWMFFAKVNDLPGKPFKVEQVDEKEYDDGGIKDSDASLHIHRFVFEPQGSEGS